MICHPHPHLLSTSLSFFLFFFFPFKHFSLHLEFRRRLFYYNNKKNDNNCVKIRKEKVKEKRKKKERKRERDGPVSDFWISVKGRPVVELTRDCFEKIRKKWHPRKCRVVLCLFCLSLLLSVFVLMVLSFHPSPPPFLSVWEDGKCSIHLSLRPRSVVLKIDSY